MALKYTTVQKFLKFIGMNESVKDFQPGNTPSNEVVASSPVSAGTYYVDQLGVNEDTLTLYAGTGTDSPLTLSSDYTFDSDSSAITITSTGATTLSGNDLTAVYEYCTLGKDLSYNETVTLLEQAETSVERRTNCVFADQSSTTPSYKSVVNELHDGKGTLNNLYSTDNAPIIKLSTTVSGAYTTGGTSIVLSDASGFPTSGTIYIGGNKVSYTNISSNTLTIPSTTPSISDGAVVRGEVVEISTSASGVSPSYEVLVPGSDYEIDYDTGRIQLMDEYYFQTDTDFEKPQDGTAARVRLSYQHAWHNVGDDAEIPDDILQAIHMVAGRQMVQRTILKSNAGQRDNFTAQSYGFSKVDVDELLRDYTFYRNSNI